MSTGARVTGECKSTPVLKFTTLAWAKMWKLTKEGVKAGNFEVSSIGIVSDKDPNLVEDFHVIKQKNTGSTTTFKEGELGLFTANMHSKGIDPGLIRVWHHTHAMMDVFWSKTDTDNIERYDSDGIMWSVVTNGHGRLKIRADMFRPFRFWWDNCDYEVEYQVDGIDEWYKANEDKIEWHKPLPTIHRGGVYQGSFYGSDYRSGRNRVGGATTIARANNAAGAKEGKDTRPFALADLHLSKEREAAAKKALEKAKSAGKEDKAEKASGVSFTEYDEEYWAHIEYLVGLEGNSDAETLIVKGKFNNPHQAGLPELIQDAYDYGYINPQDAKELTHIRATQGAQMLVIEFDKRIQKYYKEKHLQDAIWYELSDHVLCEVGTEAPLEDNDKAVLSLYDHDYPLIGEYHV